MLGFLVAQHIGTKIQVTRHQTYGNGMSRLLGGLYRYTGGGFSVISFQPDVLTSSLPYFEATEAEDAATVRGRIGVCWAVS